MMPILPCTLCLYLPYCLLLQRVSTLLADNRRLRRQAMQLQLTAAGDNGSSAGQADAAALPQTQAALTATPIETQQQLVPVDEPQAVAAADAAGAQAEADAAAAAAAVEAAELREALMSAEQHVSVLSDENERLMDLSNGLRAENDGLKKALNLQVC
jgi:hypothetical protein